MKLYIPNIAEFTATKEFVDLSGTGKIITMHSKIYNSSNTVMGDIYTHSFANYGKRIIDLTIVLNNGGVFKFSHIIDQVWSGGKTTMKNIILVDYDLNNTNPYFGKRACITSTYNVDTSIEFIIKFK